MSLLMDALKKAEKEKAIYTTSNKDEPTIDTNKEDATSSSDDSKTTIIEHPSKPTTDAILSLQEINDEPEPAIINLKDQQEISKVYTSQPATPENAPQHYLAAPTVAQAIFDAKQPINQKRGWLICFFILLIAALSVLSYTILFLLPSAYQTDITNNQKLIGQTASVRLKKEDKIDIKETLLPEIETEIQTILANENDAPLANNLTTKFEATTDKSITSKRENDTSPSKNIVQPDKENQSNIQIARQTIPSYNYQGLLKAYNAFQKGDLQQAEQIYRDLLILMPNHRDVLTGLAAISVKRKDIQKAYRYYHQILDTHGQDNSALAGLVQLTTEIDPDIGIKIIEQLLENSPQTADLYFTLGNLHGRKADWNNAQGAFFEAYRLEDSNPNYALNLAISLDHLGQYQVALKYYQTALQLSETTATLFSDKVATKMRIQSLAKNIR